MVAGRAIICYRRIPPGILEFLHIDSELVEIIGDSERQKFVLIFVQGKMVRKTEPGPLLTGIPVTVIVQENPNSGAVANPRISSQGLGLWGVFDADPLA